MQLSEILKIHTQSSKGKCLKENLGDGFLLRHNPVFRRIRNASTKLGLKFTSARFFDYDTLALTQLPKIIKKNKVPYVNNVRPLIEIEKQVSNHFQWIEVPPLKENFLLHECAHVIARQKRQEILKFPKIKKTKLQQAQEIVIGLLIEESFANTCESVANIFAESQIHDEFLYKNSYIMEKGKSRIVLREAYKKFGGQKVFKVVFLSFLYANFLKTRTAQKDLKRIEILVFGKPLKTSKNLSRDLFEVGLDLDPAFTISTNQFCLRLLGVEEDFYDVLAFDFLKHFEENASFANLLDAYAKIVFKK